MRAVCDIYEHPELSYSEVWAKDAYNRSGKLRVFTTLSVLSVLATLSTLAGCQYAGVVDLSSIVHLP